MYYRDCTSSYAVEVIREILDNADGYAALGLIEDFVNNRANTDEIGNRL